MQPLEINNTLTSILKRTNSHPSGDGWIGQCPAHEDRNPSLSITLDDQSKKILLNCFSGCDKARILHALDLTYS